MLSVILLRLIHNFHMSYRSCTAPGPLRQRCLWHFVAALTWGCISPVSYGIIVSRSETRSAIPVQHIKYVIMYRMETHSTHTLFMQNRSGSGTHVFVPLGIKRQLTKNIYQNLLPLGSHPLHVSLNTHPLIMSNTRQCYNLPKMSGIYPQNIFLNFISLSFQPLLSLDGIAAVTYIPEPELCSNFLWQLLLLWFRRYFLPFRIHCACYSYRKEWCFVCLLYPEHPQGLWC